MIELLDKSPFDVARERRLVIIADWLPPDFGAVGQYMQMRAEALARLGHEVTLVGLSSTATSTKKEAFGKGGLTEIRLRARPVPRGSLVGRMGWTLLTNLRLIASSFGALRQADGILFTGSPPFLIHFLVPLKFLWRGRLVYRITDFHPECLIAAQDEPSAFLRLLLGLTRFWRRRVDGVEVLGNDQVTRLEDSGVPADRTTLVRDGSPVSFGPHDAPFPLPAELSGRVVLLYAGNYGVAHEVETVARGYELHHRQGSGRVLLWLSATGAGAEELTRRFREKGLPFHRSAPVPLEQLASLLKSPAAHLITLKDAFVGYVMPSKVYACIESGKPIVFVGSDKSDVDALASQGQGKYWRVPCGEPERFCLVLDELADLEQSPQ